MALQDIHQIDVDFYNKNEIVVNAKQFDRKSRFILISCYSHKKFVPLDKSTHSAFVRYRKADDLAVFNKCDITEDGKVLLELTEQMLAAPGHCVADILIIDNSILVTDNAIPIITSDGQVMETVQVNTSNIISTMKFHVNVSSTPFQSSEIESMPEANALTELLEKATKDYTYIIEQASGYLEEVKEIRNSIDEEVVLAAQKEIAEKYIPEIQGYVAVAGESKDAAAQSEANSQVYESSTREFYELTKQLSITNVGDITFSLDAERRCMVATFMDDAEEDPHDWYTRFLAFLEEYANNVKTQLTEATEQANTATQAASGASKSLSDAQGVKSQCDTILEQTKQVKTSAEESLNQIKDDTLEEANAIKDDVLASEANARTCSAQAVVAKDDATTAADLAEEYMQRTKQLSVANVGEMKFAVDGERNCLVVIYTDNALITHDSDPIISANGNVIQITKGLK